jgi:carbonic anhydrase
MGKKQSPIDIQTRLVKVNKELTPLKLNGWESVLSGKFENTGHSIQFTASTSSPPSLTTPQGTYMFRQFHFHWGHTSEQGSEHCIDGDRYATEIHFVHTKSSDCEDSPDYIAVLGVLGYADSGYHTRGTPWEHIQIPEETGQSFNVDSVDISKFVPPELDYYHYKGSLTTPPCSEKVVWYVLKQPLKVPEEFLENLRQMKDDEGQSLTHTYRQCMPLHDRSVETPHNT